MPAISVAPLAVYEKRKYRRKKVWEEKSLTFSAMRTFFRSNFFPDPIRPYWLLQTFSQVIHLILLLWLSNIDLILAEYQFKLLKFLGSSATFRIQKILLLCLTMCVSLLDWDLQSTKVQTKWLQIQTKTQAFGTVQLLQPWSKVEQLRPILVLSFLAECQINYETSGQLSQFSSTYKRLIFIWWYFPPSLHRRPLLNLLILLFILGWDIQTKQTQAFGTIHLLQI